MTRNATVTVTAATATPLCNSANAGMITAQGSKQAATTTA